jgi:hypothetical protein
MTENETKREVKTSRSAESNSLGYQQSDLFSCSVRASN